MCGTRLTWQRYLDGGLRSKQKAQKQAVNETTGPHDRKKSDRSDEHTDSGFLVVLNKSKVQTDDQGEEGDGIANLDWTTYRSYSLTVNN